MDEKKENLFQIFRNLPWQPRRTFGFLEKYVHPEKYTSGWELRQMREHKMPEAKIQEMLAGQWPPLEELAFWTRFTVKTVQRHLKTLEELGMINTATREVYLTTGLTWDQDMVYHVLARLANGRDRACPRTLNHVRIAMKMEMDARDIQNSLEVLESKGAIMVATEQGKGKPGCSRERTVYRFLFHPAYEKLQASFHSFPREKMPILYQPDKVE